MICKVSLNRKVPLFETEGNAIVRGDAVGEEGGGFVTNCSLENLLTSLVDFRKPFQCVKTIEKGSGTSFALKVNDFKHC